MITLIEELKEKLNEKLGKILTFNFEKLIMMKLRNI
jgi:hypothetical protein